MSAHLKLVKGINCDGENLLIAETFSILPHFRGSFISEEHDQAILDRIADCVNACAGIENPTALPELLEALDTLTLVVGLTPIAGNKEALQEAMDIARAAIAKAKREQR